MKVSGSGTLPKGKLDEELISSGSTKVSGDLECEGFKSSGSLRGSGNLIIHGDFRCSGSFKLAGSVTVDGNAKSTGSTTIDGEVSINGISCLTTQASITHVSGEASQHKTTVVTGDTGITQAVIDGDNNSFSQGDLFTCDLTLVRTSSPTTEILNPCIVVELEPA